jgi:hypothetical protein
MGTSFGTTDSVEGGAGTDTLTLTLGAGSISGTATGVETITTTLTTDGGTLSVLNVSDLETINLVGASDDSTSVTNIASGVGIKINDAEVGALTLDTAASATLDIEIGKTTAIVINDITVTDASTVNLTTTTGTGTTARLHTLADGTGNGLVTLDNTDTTALTVTTSTYGSLTIDDFAGAGALTSMTVTTAGGAFVMDDMDAAVKLATLTLSANASDAGDITIDDLGTSGAGALRSLDTISMTASNGADISVGIIMADTNNAAGDPTISSVDLSAATTGSIVTVDEIDNGTGAITALNLTTVAGATIDLDNTGLTAASISTVTISGGGTVELDGTNAVTTISTLNATGTSTGSVTNIDLSDVTNAVTVSLGQGTTGLVSGAGGDIITLSSSAGTDTITYDALGQGEDTISGFKSTVDTIDLDISAFSTGPADGTTVAGAVVNVAFTVGTTSATQDIAYVLGAVNAAAAAPINENQLTDENAVATLIADTFTLTDSDAATADKAIFVVEAADVNGIFAIYEYLDSATSDTTVSGSELTLIAVVTANDFVIGDITTF